MAEEEMEGLDDLDSLLDDSGGGDSFAGELDDFLSDDAGDADMGGDDPMGGMDSMDADSGGDSELDSFFEDLSTIDDLEVIQEEEPVAAEAPEEVMEEVAPAAPVKEEKPKKEKKVKEKKERPFLKKMVRWIILLAIFGGGGYYAYTFLFPEGEPPWPTEETMEKLKPEFLEDPGLWDKLKFWEGWFDAEEETEPKPEKEAKLAPPPPEPKPKKAKKMAFAPAPPPPPVEPEPMPEPVPQRAPTPPPKGPAYRVQVATCVFEDCVSVFRNALRGQGMAVNVRAKGSATEAVEIISRQKFDSLSMAQEFSDNVNRDHTLEGQAYVKHVAGGYYVSMGTFPDLSRANVVKDALNQQFGEDLTFRAQVQKTSYRVRRISAGRFATRAQAQNAANRLRRSDKRFKDAFVVRY